MGAQATFSREPKLAGRSSLEPELRYINVHPCVTKHETAPGDCCFPPPILYLSQHCPDAATKTPALHPAAARHSPQHTSLELAGRASSLAGILALPRVRGGARG